MKPTFVLLFLAVAEGYHREDIPRRRLSDIVYREYRTGDKMDNGEDLTRCEEPDEPCYVAVDQAISAKAVIAVVKMTIPDDPVDEVEKMIRDHMPHPSQAGEIGVIDWVEVEEKYQRMGIATALINKTFHYIGAKKSQVVAMYLVVNPNNKEAIGLYEKTGFVKVGVDLCMRVYARYHF
ncbi:hypothetical protein FOZ62_028289 [Perkinsus olseni]|uniref:N-acetyltransferase domain-containing protein n=2 Tax=Perkinsus olseni TaxID=32597 RepID=A0A7J6QK06_PEROL|nr:hypothetical protein FOZ62_028289 [Perkinsus olseni]